jgi:putative hydrolase of the HAD superfamily
MLGIRHYSFDLWLTLIKSDPLFKQQRALYFHNRYNRHNKSLEEVTAIFRQVDIMCNTINEKTGGNIDAEEMYLMVISLINDGLLHHTDIDLQELYSTMDNLLFQHLPKIYSEDTLPVLALLKQQHGVTCNILSNTGFIKGVTLRKVLDALQLSPYFDFQLYSDELGMSKPNKRLFFKLLQYIEQVQNKPIDPDAIVHIGDNAYADIEGARAIGVKGILINSNTATIRSLIHS